MLLKVEYKKYNNNLKCLNKLELKEPKANKMI